MISCLSQSRLSVSHTTSSGPSFVFNPTFLNFLGVGTKFFSFFYVSRKKNQREPRASIIHSCSLVVSQSRSLAVDKVSGVAKIEVILGFARGKPLAIP